MNKAFKYHCFTYGQHNMVQRFCDRSFYVIHEELANKRTVENFLKQQRSNTTISVNKYPFNRIVDCLIVNFKDFQELKTICKKLSAEGHNIVIVCKGKRDFDLYVEIDPIEFKNDTHFKRFLINFFDIIDNQGYSNYRSIDIKDISKGLKATTLLIGSYNHEQKRNVQIIVGSFLKKKQQLTEYQKTIDELTNIELE